MDLDGFQDIFLVEWGHRLLGRVTGVVVLVPFVFFVARGRLRGRRAGRVVGIFLLGGLQGLAGWLMVKSGLVDEPRVSHVRLAIHLDLALLILSLLVWAALDELAPITPAPRFRAPSWARPLALGTLVLVALTVTWGALMAGLRAGHVAPTFPTMNGAWVPEGVFDGGVWAGALGVHFLHRALALCTAVGVALTAAVVLRRERAARARLTAWLLLLLLATQVTLGVWTVLSHVAIVAASLHQLNGALLLATSVALLHALRER
jgi:cytochrome c oxidase assembly protein subunit 15